MGGTEGVTLLLDGEDGQVTVTLAGTLQDDVAVSLLFVNAIHGQDRGALVGIEKPTVDSIGIEPVVDGVGYVVEGAVVEIEVLQLAHCRHAYRSFVGPDDGVGNLGTDSIDVAKKRLVEDLQIAPFAADGIGEQTCLIPPFQE